VPTGLTNAAQRSKEDRLLKKEVSKALQAKRLKNNLYLCKYDIKKTKMKEKSNLPIGFGRPVGCENMSHDEFCEHIHNHLNEQENA